MLMNPHDGAVRSEYLNNCMQMESVSVGRDAVSEENKNTAKRGRLFDNGLRCVRACHTADGASRSLSLVRTCPPQSDPSPPWAKLPVGVEGHGVQRVKTEVKWIFRRGWRAQAAESKLPRISQRRTRLLFCSFLFFFQIPLTVLCGLNYTTATSRGWRSLLKSHSMNVELKSGISISVKAPHRGPSGTVATLQEKIHCETLLQNRWVE